MSYGFDPSELIETKIDLIDKDGFHGVGTADNGENSGGNNGETDIEPSDHSDCLHEGIYVNYYTSVERNADYTQDPPVYSEDTYQSIYVSVVADMRKYPDVFSEVSTVNRNNYGIMYKFYFGDKLNDNDWHIVDDTSLAYGNDETVGFYLAGTSNGQGDRVGDGWLVFSEYTHVESIIDEKTGNQLNVLAIEPGTPIHCVVAVDGANLNSTKFIFIDDVWNVEGLL